MSINLINKGRAYLDKKFGPAFYTHYPKAERIVQAAAWLVDVIRPRELRGKNDGEVVSALLDNVKVARGLPWCAAMVAMVCDVAKVGRPRKGAASVIAWWAWAKIGGHAIPVRDVTRGDLVLASYGGGTGHIGIAYRRLAIWVWTFEGNTQPGDGGDQREGQGGYRRRRRLSFWNLGGIRL